MSYERTSPIDFLESPNTISILVYVFYHEGCIKTDIYKAVSHSSTMPDKVGGLEDAGLIRTESDVRRRSRVYLTPKGRTVAEMLCRVNDIMAEAP